MRVAVRERLAELGAGTIVVDDPAPWSRALNLDHHVGARTPPAWRGDVSTAVVLAALDAGLDPAEYRCAAIRHFDTDGCLAVWALTHPREALAQRDLLLAAARYGDFYEAGDDAGARNAVALSCYLQEHLFEAHARERRAPLRDLFAHALEQLPRVLRDPGCVEAAWREHVERFEEDRAALASRPRGAASRVRVVELAREPSLGALVSSFDAPVLVWTVPEAGGRQYGALLRPRYGWGYASEAVGDVLLRDLRPACARLQTRERARGGRARWYPETFDRTVWRLRTHGAPSALPPEVVHDELEALLPHHSSPEAASPCA